MDVKKLNLLHQLNRQSGVTPVWLANTWLILKQDWPAFFDPLTMVRLGFLPILSMVTFIIKTRLTISGITAQVTRLQMKSNLLQLTCQTSVSKPIVLSNLLNPPLLQVRSIVMRLLHRVQRWLKQSQRWIVLRRKFSN